MKGGNELAPAPPLDVSLQVSRAADHAFGRVGRCKRLAQAIREAEGEHREGLVESFPNARCGPRIGILESAAKSCSKRRAVATSVRL